MIEQMQALLKALEAGTHETSQMMSAKSIFDYFKKDPYIKFYGFRRFLSKEPERSILNPFCKENGFPEMSDQEILNFIAVSLKLNS